jgi:hypothetical protein
MLVNIFMTSSQRGLTLRRPNGNKLGFLLASDNFNIYRKIYATSCAPQETARNILNWRLCRERAVQPALSYSLSKAGQYPPDLGITECLLA